MRLLFFLFCFGVAGLFISPAQEELATTSADSLDTKYREDQFYFGVSYNLLINKPMDMSQNGFSSGFHLGFIRDMPINSNRDIAIGLGFGYSVNSINQNLKISKNDQNDFVFEVLENGSFSKNKLSMHLLEVPLEFRWRTSTPSEYKFWRIYSGIKFGYVFASRTKFNSESENIVLKGPDIFNRFQYGLTLSAGYDKFNLHIYYGLTPIFKNDSKTDTSNLDVRVIRIGLMLYFL